MKGTILIYLKKKSGSIFQDLFDIITSFQGIKEKELLFEFIARKVLLDWRPPSVEATLRKFEVSTLQVQNVCFQGGYLTHLTDFENF